MQKCLLGIILKLQTAEINFEKLDGKHIARYATQRALP